MINFDIPKDWEMFISYSFNRVYISPASGCSANCAYCFIFDYGHPRRPRIFEASGEEIKKWLLSQPGFRAGRQGTLISLAPSCDPFADDVVDKTLEILKSLAPLENPMQLSTKFYVNEDIAQRLGEYQSQDGQIVLYGTITSFLQWQRLEPGAHEPYRRLQGLLNARQQGITTCLAIKPVLPGITDKEIDLFIQAIDDYKIQYCAVGIMYSSSRIEEKFQNRKILNNQFAEMLKAKGSITPPAHCHDDHKIAYDIPTLEVVEEILPKLSSTEAECIISGPCAVALSYSILCPTGVWKYRPHLCVNCSAECESQFSKSAPEIRNLFPNLDPPPD